MRGKKLKSALIIILILCLLLGSAGGYFALIYQPAATVSDRTTADATDPTGTTEPGSTSPDPGTDEPEENQAVLSANVTVFTDSTGDEINSAIQSLESTSDGVTMVIETGTAFDSLGAGDIFYLEGDNSTPFGMTYISKIASILPGDGTASYLLETPSIDEVFDQLTINSSDSLTSEDIVSIETIPGIRYSTVSSLSASAGDSRIVPLETFTESSSLMFEVEAGKEIDLLEVFGLREKDPDGYETADITEGSRIHVYCTKTGQCYHKEGCRYLSKSKTEITLAEAVDGGLRPCSICKPALLKDEGTVNLKAEFKLNGNFGLEKIDYAIVCDWDILHGNGIENLSYSIDGKFVSNLAFKTNLNLELSARTTKYTFLEEHVQFEGLKERMFPLAYIHFGTTISLGTGIPSGNQKAIRRLTGRLPLSIVAIVYVDLSGNLSLGAEISLAREVEFHYSRTIYQDGTLVNETDAPDPDDNTTLTFALEASGDGDIHAGAGLDFYIYNLKLLQVDLFQAGLKAEGTMQLRWSNDATDGIFDPWDEVYSRSIYAEAYCKICEVKLGFKAKAEFESVNLEVGTGVNYSYLLKYITLQKWGEPNPARYDSSTMSYTNVTAKDANASYYMDLDGTLAREVNGQPTVIYDGSFFCICGIDESYLYVMVPDGYGKYNITRISKDGTTSKTILESISDCLTFDEDYLYYLDGFDDTVIRRLNRYNLDIEKFADFDHPVNYMDQQGDNFYIVTEDSDIFSFFFGATYYYTLVNADGEIIADYGSSPQVSQLDLTDFGSYYLAREVVSSGHLRGVAAKIYWLSRDRSSYVLTDCVSGWNYFSIGIITTLANDTGSAHPYKMVLYRASDGSRSDITTVYHDCAFFTLCQGRQGEWYYFDQTDTQLILYRLSPNLTGKTVVKTFSLEDMPCNLEDCGVSILDGRIFFYTMPDDSTCTVLYRYDMD